MILSQKIQNITAGLMLVMLGCATAAAQNYQLPGQHRLQHGDLLANQENTGAQVDNTTRYLETLFNEEEIGRASCRERV